MNRHSRKLALTATLLTLLFDAQAQPGFLYPFRLDNLAWLAGTWRGLALGGRAEESWIGPLDGVMAGTFSLTIDNEERFREILLIHETSSAIYLRFQHRQRARKENDEQANHAQENDEPQDNKTSPAPPEPPVLKLVDLGPDRAVFQNFDWAQGEPALITYEYNGNNELIIRSDPPPDYREDALPPASFIVYLQRAK